jgi:glycosyltransferase involved in cell wall biosynthesis
MYNKAHILLDQVYSYDQGYNALEAMAKGKVVFTGAEQEFTEHYNLAERVAINALPDVSSLVNELSYLIEDPDEIIAISKRARAFVEKEHDYVKVAQKYLQVWNKY